MVSFVVNVQGYRSRAKASESVLISFLGIYNNCARTSVTV